MGAPSTLRFAGRARSCSFCQLGGNYQCRIKSADEPHDRDVKESELDRAM